MKRLLALAATATLLAGLTACSDTNAPTTVATEDGQRPTESSSPTAPVSPLDGFLNEIYGLDVSPQERSDRDYAEQTDIENRVAACMKAEGFDYIPAPVRKKFQEIGRDGAGVSEADRDDPAWVAEYGYGFAQSPQHALTDPVTDTLGGPSETVNPNQSYIDGLSASQRTAYEVALWGPQDAGRTVELVDAGCSGAAIVAVQGSDPSDSDEFAPTFEAIDDFYSTSDSWPGVAELEAAWVACMSDNGRSGFTRQSDAPSSIRSLQSDLTSSANAPGTEAGTFVPPAIADLEALAASERELALIDLDCRTQVDYRDTYDAIAFEQEERFMADNREALDALRAAYEQRDDR